MNIIDIRSFLVAKVSGIVTSFVLEMIYDVPYFISTSRQSWALDEAKSILMHQAKAISTFNDRNLVSITLPWINTLQALITKLVRGKIRMESLYYGDQLRAVTAKDTFLPAHLQTARDKGKITTYMQWCKQHCSPVRIFLCALLIYLLGSH